MTNTSTSTTNTISFEFNLFGVLKFIKSKTQTTTSKDKNEKFLEDTTTDTKTKKQSRKKDLKLKDSLKFISDKTFGNSYLLIKSVINTIVIKKGVEVAEKIALYVTHFFKLY